MEFEIDIDERLLRRAAELTGVEDPADLVRSSLELLVARKSSQKLAELGGTEAGAERAPRRRPRG